MNILFFTLQAKVVMHILKNGYGGLVYYQVSGDTHTAVKMKLCNYMHY